MFSCKVIVRMIILHQETNCFCGYKITAVYCEKNERKMKTYKKEKWIKCVCNKAMWEYCCLDLARWMSTVTQHLPCYDFWTAQWVCYKSKNGTVLERGYTQNPNFMWIKHDIGNVVLISVVLYAKWLYLTHIIGNYTNTSLTVYKQQDMVGAFKYGVQNNGITIIVTVVWEKVSVPVAVIC